MRRRAIVSAAAVAAALLYPWLHRWLFGVITVYLLPPGLLHTARHLGGLAGLLFVHAAVSFLLTAVLFLPVAVLIALAFRRRWIVVAATAAAWLVAPDLIAIPDIWRQVFDRVAYMRSLILGVIVLLGALLASTYAASRLTSNNRWRGP
jgi:hypothetical protein